MSKKKKKVIAISGTHSGVGKTTTSVGIMAALRLRGYSVQPFKVGPDFLDPKHHEAACGRHSINLDGWMLTREQNIAQFWRSTEDCDIAVIEGVMGLYDGRDGVSEVGSTSEMVKWLGCPTALVVDCWAMSRSVAAMVKGYLDFDRDLNLRGVIMNKVGGSAHAAWLRDATITAGLDVEILGCVTKNDVMAVQERHLGLHQPHEQSGALLSQQQMPEYLVRIAEHVAEHIDLDALIAMAGTATVPFPTQPTPVPAALPTHRIGIAKDQAFSFYYYDNLQLLQAAGAELVFFSPMSSDNLPLNLSGIYIGGGYPELHTRELSANTKIRQQIKAFADAGGVVYGECGGLMYLSQSLQAINQTPLPMVGVLPFRTRMTPKMRMGYVSVLTSEESVLFPPGIRLRGQVYHFGEIVKETVLDDFSALHAGDIYDAEVCQEPVVKQTYMVEMQATGAPPVLEGYTVNRVTASYVHLHFGSHPQSVWNFLHVCASCDQHALQLALAEYQDLDLRPATWSTQSNMCNIDACTATGSIHSPVSTSTCGFHGLQGQQEQGLAPNDASSQSLPDLHTLGGGFTSCSASGISDGGGAYSSSTRGKSKLMGGRGHCDGDMACTVRLFVRDDDTCGVVILPIVTMANLNTRLICDDVSKSRCPDSGRALQTIYSGRMTPSGNGHAQGEHSSQASSRVGQHQQGSLHTGSAYAHDDVQTSSSSSDHSTHVNTRSYTHNRAQLRVDTSSPQAVLKSNSQQNVRFTIGQQRVAGPMQRLQDESATFPRTRSADFRYVSDSFDQHQYSPTKRSAVSRYSSSTPYVYASALYQHGHRSRPAHYKQYPSVQKQVTNHLSISKSSSFHSLNSADNGTQGSSEGHYSTNSHTHGASQTHSVASAHAPAPLPNVYRKSFDHAARALYASRNGVYPSGDYNTGSTYPKHFSRQPIGENTEFYHKADPLMLDTERYSPVPCSPPRHGQTIASLTPSGTELVAALGQAHRLVAVSDGCDYPENIQQDRTVVYTPVVSTRTLTSTEVGQQLVELEEKQKGAFIVNEEALRRMRPRPGTVIMQAGAKFCDHEKEAVTDALERVGYSVHDDTEQSGEIDYDEDGTVCLLKPRLVADVLEGIMQVACQLNVQEAGQELVFDCRKRLRGICQAVGGVRVRKTVLFIESVSPLTVGGYWIPEMIQLAGGNDGVMQPGDEPLRIKWEQVLQAKPDVLIFSTEPDDLAKLITQLSEFVMLPSWWALKAVYYAQVYVVNQAYFTRASQRMVQGVEILARILEPKRVGVALPPRACWKIDLKEGQRCRAKLLGNYLLPYGITSKHRDSYELNIG